MKVELLVIPGCPHSQPAAELLRQALDALGLSGVEFDTHLVATQAEAERWQFAGSPTFLIDGVDPFATAPTPASVACRVYPTPAGLRGLPAVEELRAALAPSP